MIFERIWVSLPVWSKPPGLIISQEWRKTASSLAQKRACAAVIGWRDFEIHFSGASDAPVDGMRSAAVGAACD